MKTSQRQTPPRDVAHFQAPSQKDLDPSPATNMHAGTESTSDADAGEPPVREQLKKTSLASMPRPAPALSGADVHNSIATDVVMDTKGGVGEQETQPKELDSRSESRGRPIRKRSLEELDTAKTDQGDNSEIRMEPTDGHARKRSRDVRSGANLRPNSRRASLEIPLKKVNEIPESSIEMTDSATMEMKASVETNTPTSEKDVADEEMQESVLSPRKKRSRDQFEAESHREQKIAATDETRARRRSSEEERRETHAKDDKPQIDERKTGEQNGYIHEPKDASSGTQKESSTVKVSLFFAPQQLSVH